MQLNDPTLFRRQALINGEWRDGDHGATEAVTNPATGDVLAEVAQLSAAQTESAISAAADALVSWRALTGKQRGLVLQKWAA